jgi:squalene-hopene/tetraprenyl-beta-curcumene cyclase
VLLWASAKLVGLLTREQQNAIAAEILTRQQQDGGFSMSSLVGSWKRKDRSPLDTTTDGYATGLIAFTLEQLNTPETQPALHRALKWLSTSQAEDGRWPASSLNKHRELSSEAGLFMSDAATA